MKISVLTLAAIPAFVLTTQFCIAASVVNINGQSAFDSHIKANEFVVVKFHSPYCPACKNFAPTFEQAASMPGVSFIAVDITKPENKSIYAKYPIQGVPTVHYLKNGKLIPASDTRTVSGIQQNARNAFGLER